MNGSLNKNIQYEGIGFFLSFITYPYYIDGKELYNRMFKPFFYAHKKQISLYDPDTNNSSKTYIPAGYRMFGSNGLTILSLVDDYSFYNRFFNKNHIQTLLHDKKQKGKDEDEVKKNLNFTSVVISGVTELGDRTIIETATDTFLQPDKSKRYKFIGIMRLKIDYYLLVGNDNAINTINRIKNTIKTIFEDPNKKKARSDYFIMDCYDSDEMTIVAFSDELLTLYNFLGNIRSITNKSIGQQYKDERTEKHVFGLTYLCFGYDPQCRWNNDLATPYYLNCTIQTKPGHRDDLYNYLLGIESSLKIRNLSANISGGCNISFSIPLRNIIKLEKLCIEDSIRYHARDVKISLIDILDTSSRDVSNISFKDHIKTEDNLRVEPFGRGEILKVKEKMKEVGVSKMVRERLLALLELYNYSCKNILQGVYLRELEPALKNFYTMIDDFSSNPQESISSIEEMLNEEISHLEAACYDRLHIQKNNPAPLEYSSGIQQYLTSFDFAYKQIYQLFSPNDNGAFYVTISGAERASSTRMLFNLNIHDIIFPELFITTVWKEISNFALKTQIKREIRGNHAFRNQLDSLNTWNNFISNHDSFYVLHERVQRSKNLMPEDDVCKWVMRLFSPELIEYFIKDYIVFHFAFTEDFKLIWHFYHKILLQSTSCYHSLNHIDKRYVIDMMLRLFMIAKLSGKDENRSYIKEMENKPFDSIVGTYWKECYHKVLEISDEIFDVLQIYGFKDMIDCTIKIYEGNIFFKETATAAEDLNNFNGTKKDTEEFNPDNIQPVLSERRRNMDIMSKKMNEGQLIYADIIDSPKGKGYSFLINLMGAFLKSAMLLDCPEEASCCAIKCIPRDRKGRINKIMEVKKTSSKILHQNIINIPIDATGGFFVPSSNIRMKYFQLRTTFYRSLWNYCFMYKGQN